MGTYTEGVMGASMKPLPLTQGQRDAVIHWVEDWNPYAANGGLEAKTTAEKVQRAHLCAVIECMIEDLEKAPLEPPA